MIKKYISEIMRQDFSDINTPDLFKLGLLSLIREHDYILDNIPIHQIQKYIYRYIIDNKKLYINNSNDIVNNIESYYSMDLNGMVLNCITEWIEVGAGILSLSKNYKYISTMLTTLTPKEHNYLDLVTKNIFGKFSENLVLYKNSIMNELESIYSVNNGDELIFKINNSRLRNRVIENIKYCMCCDEINLSELLVVPIVKDIDFKYVYTSENSIVLCKEHYDMYHVGFFLFDSNGNIIINQKNLKLDSRMRISRNLLTDIRKESLLYLNKNLSTE